MARFEESQKLRSLPPYIFSEINTLKAEALKKGISLTSLAIGDPDQPTPASIVKLIQEAAQRPENHAYSPYEGTLKFRQTAADWMQKRFGVQLDATSEVVAVIGTKEAIAHFPVAFCNPGDKCLYPSPGYPVFSTSIHLAGAVPVPLSLRIESGFVPDLNELEEAFRNHQPKYMILNYPANPTSATIRKEILADIVALARRYHIILLYDNAYSEIYYDANNKPPSILEIPGAKEVAIELHSFSKSYNMTGWRLGFAAGNRDLVAGLLRAKTNIDSGPLLAVQDAAVQILANADEYSEPIRQLYGLRRSALLSGLDRLGIEYFPPQATFFVWARVPGGRKSMAFTRELIEKTGVVVTPGIGFGPEGEGFFRLAMTVDVPAIEHALARIEKVLS